MVGLDIRPMNKTLIIEVDGDLIPFTDNEKVAEALGRGLILLPEKNSFMKISDHARVISAANDCVYPYKKNQRIRYDHKRDSPLWHFCNGKRYRIIKEHYIDWVYEDD